MNTDTKLKASEFQLQELSSLALRDEQHNAFARSFDTFFKNKKYSNSHFYQCHESYFQGIDDYKAAILRHAAEIVPNVKYKDLEKLLESKPETESL